MIASMLIGFLGFWWNAIDCTAISPEKDPAPTGGTVKIEFMEKSNVDEERESILLTRHNSTMFTHSAPLAPAEGVWGELIPFHPLDACSSLKSSNYTRKVNDDLQFVTVGPYPHVVALVARGNYTFEEKFDNVDDVSNVIGMIMYDIEDGDNLSNDIEISTFRLTKIPGFLIDYKTGTRLLSKIHVMRGKDSEEDDWIKVTLRYVGLTGPIVNILQFTLFVVIILLGVAFATSVYMHFRIYRLQQELEEQHDDDARNGIIIDEAFMEKLPLRKYFKFDPFTTDDAEGGGGIKDSQKLRESTLSFSGAASSSAPIEDLFFEQYEGQTKHAPPNEMCPICLDDFEVGEMLNELYCGHFYHPSCIQPWLLNRNPCCPMCKIDVRDAFIAPPISPARDGDGEIVAEESEGRNNQSSLFTKTKGFFAYIFCCKTLSIPRNHTSRTPSPIRTTTEERSTVLPAPENPMTEV